MVIRTIALLASLAVLLFNPRAPSDGHLTSRVGGGDDGQRDEEMVDNEDVDVALSRNVRKLKKITSGGSKNGCEDVNGCCGNPVYKMLPLGKLIPLETGKHYLVRHVRLLRCPSTLGCCQSFREQCVPILTENTTIAIPVEEPVGHHQYAYVNQTFTFEQHLQCGCRNRTHQALANFISRELLSQYDADDALEMVARICRAVRRRIKKLRRFDSRFRVHRKKKNRRRRSRLC